MKVIERGISNSNEIVAKRLMRLKKIIQTNCSYLIHRSIEKAKIDLSEKEKTTIEVDGIDLSVILTRVEFEEIINQVVLELRESIETLLEKADICPDDINIVIRTGGSSLIPIVYRELEAKFPGKVVEFNVFKSIAAGLAIANFYGYESNPSWEVGVAD